MLKIGEFSKLSRTTIKTLRFYEKEGLIFPHHVDKFTNYRYYETSQLLELSKIISLRQANFSIDEIKEILKTKNLTKSLEKKEQELKNSIFDMTEKLQRIKYLIKEKEMKKEVFKKELPDYVVYYKEGVLKDYGQATQFILDSASECLKLNPNLKCVQPDYCFMSYLDGMYKEKNIKVRYSQAVENFGIESDTIKFEKLKPQTAMCIYHKGPYKTLNKTYSYIIKWIEDNNYKIVAPIREMYIDGVWNKENEEDYLTEIQIPVERI